MERDLASSSRPRKSPRLIDQAQRRELIQDKNEKEAKEKQNSYLCLRRSPRLIEQAQHQELEHSEHKRKRQKEERWIHERIRHTFVSEIDKTSKLEQRRIHDKDRRRHLTQEEIERNLEKRRNAYRKRQQIRGQNKDMNQDTSTTAASTSRISTSQIDIAIEGNQPTKFNNLRRSPRFLSRDKMVEPGPISGC